MGLVTSLFDEPSSFDRERLAASLARLAAQGIYIGGSSWKYEGWFGQVYSRERYMQRGRFSRRLFEAACLKEYAETFPAVCGDFSFYQYPSDEMWRRLFEQTPPGFQFAFKVPEQVTCKVFPSHPRYGKTSGQENPAFLDVELLKTMFLAPLEPYRAKTGVLVFEFGTFSKKSFPELSAFLEHLDRFLAALPGDFRYSVEIRNPEYLEPEYFECLRRHRVAHVYNAWSRMPELKRQIAIPESVTADFVVTRALLRYGRSYEKAVEAFSPYTEVRDPNPETRDALRVLVDRSREQRRLAFIFVNNRLEGNAPATIISIVE